MHESMVIAYGGLDVDHQRCVGLDLSVPVVQACRLQAQLRAARLQDLATLVDEAVGLQAHVVGVALQCAATVVQGAWQLNAQGLRAALRPLALDVAQVVGAHAHALCLQTGPIGVDLTGGGQAQGAYALDAGVLRMGPPKKRSHCSRPFWPRKPSTAPVSL